MRSQVIGSGGPDADYDESGFDQSAYDGSVYGNRYDYDLLARTTGQHHLQQPLARQRSWWSTGLLLMTGLVGWWL